VKEVVVTSGGGANVLDDLREQCARVNAKIDSMAEDLRSVKVRLTSVESEIVAGQSFTNQR